ncbi:uncharacterized protein LOC100368382 [Saccoglossus kowalevskii]|uniref:Uncharacterized protein LOC100368382 n=1 Tax=Saccoglossus kowalevskii TaxID=10224 RepID=A0ABM0GVC2_SACKO|nr:PREDICTED: uncharacterized protein LOC100368382 [Saccoglossus kowalevskii]
MKILVLLLLSVVSFDVVLSAWVPSPALDREDKGLLDSIEWIKEKEASEIQDNTFESNPLEDKRGNKDYGWGTLFGKRSKTKRSLDDEYGWGTTFGKRNAPSKKEAGKSDYGWGMMFGKRNPNLNKLGVQRWGSFDNTHAKCDETSGTGCISWSPKQKSNKRIHFVARNGVDKRGDIDWKRGGDYGWGMVFGKRNYGNHDWNDKRGEQYGWGLILGKRDWDDDDTFVNQIPDRDFDDYETDVLSDEDDDDLNKRSTQIFDSYIPRGYLGENVKTSVHNKRSPFKAHFRLPNRVTRADKEYGWEMILG